MSQERNFKVDDLVDYDGGILKVIKLYQVTPEYDGGLTQSRVVASTPDDPIKGVIVDAPDYYFTEANNE